MTTDQDQGDLRGQLGEAVATMLDRQYRFEQRQLYRKDPHGYSRDVWRAYAELGLLGLGVSEEHGGFGGGLEDMGVVFERLGAALSLEPLLTTIVFGGRLIDAAGSPEQKAVWLPPLVSGDLVVALAHDEPQSRYGSMSLRTLARPSSRGWVLSGEKRLVAGGDAAGLLVVSSLIQGEAGQEELALWLIDPEADGVRRRRRQSFDGAGLADIVLDDVHLGPGDRLGAPTRVPSWNMRWMRSPLCNALTRSAPWPPPTASLSTTSGRVLSSVRRSGAFRRCSTASSTWSLPKKWRQP